MKVIDIAVPDLGNFAEVPVIDVLVKAGDTVEAEAPLITLETDKASMDVPAPVGGRLLELLVAKGAKVSKGTVIARIEVEGAAAASPVSKSTDVAASPTVASATTSATPAAVPTVTTEAAPTRIETGPVPGVPKHTQVLVLGAGRVDIPRRSEPPISGWR